MRVLPWAIPSARGEIDYMLDVEPKLLLVASPLQPGTLPVKTLPAKTFSTP
jgi:hypothetical protein